MCQSLRDNNKRDGNGKTPFHTHRGLCRRLQAKLNTFSIIIVSISIIVMVLQQQTMPCSALVLMMTPTALTPLPTNTPSTSDNVAAAAADDDEKHGNALLLSPLTTMTNNKTIINPNNGGNNLQPPNALTTNSPPPAIPLPPSSSSSTSSTSSPQRIATSPRVQLNKCCLFGEYLDITKTCVPGASDKWVPLIYLMRRNTYFVPHGTKPKFITFQDNVFPINQARNINDDGQSDNEDNVSCTVEDLVLITGSNIVVFSNGSLYIPERGITLPPSRYCVDQQTALVCFQKSKVTEPPLKLRKCCGQHGIYDGQKKQCHFEGSQKRHLNLTLPEATTFQTIYGFPECREDSNTYAVAGEWSEVKLLSDTTGHLHIPEHKVNLTSADYCLEYIREEDVTDNGQTVKVFACLHHFPGEHTSSNHQLAALNFGLVISVIFLGATLVASYLMPSIHHVLHWRCQIYYVFCLFIGEFLLAFSQLFSSLIEHMAICNVVASTMHFFFLSAFFWLNTMCFNIWWTFRDFRPSSLERNQELIRLRLYSAYAWGIPLLIAAIAACVNLVPESSLLRPGFGERSCWFNGEHLAIFAYFYGPVGILMSINIMLFVSTTHQLTCGLWKRDDVKSTTEKTALGKVCLKLVVVMGVTWIVDVLSWLIGGPDSAWFVTDLINVLQGVFIFLVVGCQPQVWAACKRFCCPRSRQEITNTTNGVQHSSSSQGLPSMAACGGEITQNTSVHNTTLGSCYGGGSGGGGTGGGGGGGVIGGAVNHIPNTTPTNTSTPMKIPMETVC